MSNEAGRRIDEPRSARAVLLRLCRDRGPLARIELARASGLSATTVSRAVNGLLDEGVLVEGDSVSVSRLGRKATELSIRCDAFVVVGVQIGVGFFHLGLVDLAGNRLTGVDAVFDMTEEPDSVLHKVAAAIRELLDAEEIEWRRVLGVGVGVPGPVDAAGRRLLLPVNLQWRDVDVADVLERDLGTPVTVEHNVRSMALAETRFGCARGLESVAFVYLRTGLGAGLVVEGQPFVAGVHGAIELGHLQVAADRRPCVCGNEGCLETIVSQAALQASAERLGLPASGNPLTAMWEAMGSVAAAEPEVEVIVGSLAKGLAAVSNLLNPALILLGGSLAAIPEALFDRVRERTRASVFATLRPSLRVEASSLGMDAGVLGGATVALDTFFYN